MGRKNRQNVGRKMGRKIKDVKWDVKFEKKYKITRNSKDVKWDVKFEKIQNHTKFQGRKNTKRHENPRR